MYSEVKNAACPCVACKYMLTRTRSCFEFIRSIAGAMKAGTRRFSKQLQIPAYVHTYAAFCVIRKNAKLPAKKRQAAAGIPAAGAHCACCEGTTQNPACVRAGTDARTARMGSGCSGKTMDRRRWRGRFFACRMCKKVLLCLADSAGW